MKYFNTTCPRPSIDLTEIQALRLGLRQGGGCTEKEEKEKIPHMCKSIVINPFRAADQKRVNGCKGN